MESWNHGVMESWNHGIMESWNHGVMESWNHGGAQRHPGGTRRHPGDPGDAQRHPGGTQEAPRRQPGGDQEAPRRHPEAPRRRPGGQRQLGGKCVQNHRVLPKKVARATISRRRERPDPHHVRNLRTKVRGRVGRRTSRHTYGYLNQAARTPTEELCLGKHVHKHSIHVLQKCVISAMTC